MARSALLPHVFTLLCADMCNGAQVCSIDWLRKNVCGEGVINRAIGVDAVIFLHIFQLNL